MTTPVPPVPPVKSSSARSGCMTVLLVALALAVVTVAGLLVAGWVFVRSETGQRVIETAREGIAMTKEAAFAPGTQALRDGGCSQAMVMPTARMLELLGKIAPEARIEVSKELPDGATMVFCELPRGDQPALTCEDVARIYSEAVPSGDARFAVVVRHRGSNKAVCEGTYDRTATSLEPLERN
jgi:hypothetical protein